MRKSNTNTLIIRTPEGISFSLLLAGPVTRFFAWAIDFGCILVITTIFSILLLGIGILSWDLANAINILMYFVISIGYGILLEWRWRGQTLGKRLLKLRVMDVQGLRLQLSQVVIRNLLRFVDSLPLFYLVGGAASIISKRAQRLGDFAANTLVIRNRPIAEYNLDEVTPGKYNSFRDHPYLEARLRQKASLEEATLALKALLRREELDPKARVEMFREMAAHFRSMATFPEEATSGLTDEQYIRNVVDAIFRTRQPA